MKLPGKPIIYEINTAVFLNELSSKYNQNITLANVPDEVWDSLAGFPIDAVWFMGIWRRSPIGTTFAKENKEQYQEVLPDIQDEDIIGSAYCIYDYVIDDKWGGAEGLAIARQKLAGRGLGVILDFVPNHVGFDHPWIESNPDFFIQGTSEDAKKNPKSFYDTGSFIVAKGKDPNFDPWSDVAQLNAFSEGYRQATADTLKQISAQCDGVRCDMAMLMLNSIFQNTWRDRAGAIPATDYWPTIINAVRETSPDFLFIAEVYWDLENTLLEQGFNYCYDKDFYDLLHNGHVRPLIHHLEKPNQDKMLRFIENHDEERAAGIFPEDRLQAAAVTLTLLDGAKLYLDGQFLGHKTRIPVQLGRAPAEASNPKLEPFYRRLLEIAKSFDIQRSKWTLLKPKGKLLNLPSNHVIAWQWEGDKTLVVAVNYSSHPSKVNIPTKIARTTTKAEMLLQSSEVVLKPGNEEIFLQLGPWGHAVAQLQ